MDFIAKCFSELSTRELYEILKSRSEIFMLEENIICQDMDDVDSHALHCFFYDGKRVQAYLRAYQTGNETVSIGRVLTLSHGKGLGRAIMNEGMSAIKKHFVCKKLSLHAQKHAESFYEKMGFRTVSDEFLEEGVLHVTMEMDA